MLEKLENRLKELNNVAISYSGGIDSSFLLYVANKVLPKENVLAIIANGCMMSKTDYNEAIEFLNENKFQYIEIAYNPLDISEFKENKKDRCYYCKKNLMIKVKNTANENGFNIVLDGKNADDLKIYRPGNRVGEEINILSPLAELGFDKKSIRDYAHKLGIKIWNKPSNSCLATRFPYNTILTKENLKKVELSEEIIKNLKIEQVRVRVHGEIARIEVPKKDFNIILNNENAIKEIKKVGFKFVTLDLLGLQSGSFD